MHLKIYFLESTKLLLCFKNEPYAGQELDNAESVENDERNRIFKNVAGRMRISKKSNGRAGIWRSSGERLNGRAYQRFWLL